MDPTVIEFLSMIWNVIITVIFPVVIITLLIVVLVHLKKVSPPSDKPEVSIRLIRKDLLYLAIIFGILITFVLVLAFAGGKDAFQYFSFASTITSMVLSVIAIIMTIINEQKSDRVRAVIEESVEELKAASKQVKKYANQIDTQRDTLDGLVEKMDENLKRTKKLLDNTEKLKKEFHNINRDLSSKNYDDLDDEAAGMSWNEVYESGLDDDMEEYLDDGVDGSDDDWK